MFIVALFVIGQNWKSLRCLSIGERSKILAYGMKYYSTVKGNGLPTHEKTWRTFKCILHFIMKSESLSENAIYCMIIALCHSGKGTTIDRVKRSEIATSWREGVKHRFIVEHR